MDRRRYLEALGTVVSTGALAGCTGSGNGNTSPGGGDDSGNGGSNTTDTYGTLSTSVTDQPNDIGDFESLVVTIEGIWVKPVGTGEEGYETPDSEGDDTSENEDGTATDGDTDTATGDGNGDGQAGDNDGDGDDDGDIDGDEGDEGDVGESAGREYIEFENTQEADLVELQGGETRLVGETELEGGEYEYLQLDVSGTTGVLVEGSEEATVETPGSAPLQFKQAFEIRAGETTHFIADFAPFRRGNGTYLIRPVASGTEVRYGDGPGVGAEDSDSEEGDSEDGGDESTDDSDRDNGAANEDTPNGSETDGNGPSGAAY